jgi:hypothetical protein
MDKLRQQGLLVNRTDVKKVLDFWRRAGLPGLLESVNDFFQGLALEGWVGSPRHRSPRI